MDVNSQLQQVASNYAQFSEDGVILPRNPIPSIPYPVSYRCIQVEGPVVMPGACLFKSFSIGIKVGTAVESWVRQQIREDVRTIITKSGGRFDEVYGSAWCFYGMRS